MRLMEGNIKGALLEWNIVGLVRLGLGGPTLTQGFLSPSLSDPLGVTNFNSSTYGI